MGEKIKIIELDFVNAFLIEVEGGNVLIDTGYPMHWEKLLGELMSVNCLPDKLKLVILTHGDMDHTGNCANLQKKYNVKIAIHQEDVFMAEKGVSLNRKVRTLSAKIFVLIRKLRRSFQSKKIIFETFKPDVFLSDGQSLIEYGLDAKVIHIPGHTKGSIGILTKEGSLFAGDIFFNRKKPVVSYYVHDELELNASVEKLKKIDIRMVYPGHGKPFPFQDFKDI